jgi:hypothetical protein
MHKYGRSDAGIVGIRSGLSAIVGDQLRKLSNQLGLVSGARSRGNQEAPTQTGGTIGLVVSPSFKPRNVLDTLDSMPGSLFFVKR